MAVLQAWERAIRLQNIPEFHSFTLAFPLALKIKKKLQILKKFVKGSAVYISHAFDIFKRLFLQSSSSSQALDKPWSILASLLLSGTPPLTSTPSAKVATPTCTAPFALESCFYFAAGFLGWGSSRSSWEVPQDRLQLPLLYSYP